jgi:hypothetical protein
MPSATAITELETELSQTRDAAGALLAQLAAMIEAEDFSIYDELPLHLVARAREVSGRFHVPLVRVLSLVMRSQMLGITDADAIRLAVRRVDAALRLRQYEQWGPEILNDEDRVLAARRCWCCRMTYRGIRCIPRSMSPRWRRTQRSRCSRGRSRRS